MDRALKRVLDIMKEQSITVAGNKRFVSNAEKIILELVAGNEEIL